MRSASMPVTGATRSGDQSRGQLPQRVDTVDVVGQAAQPDQVLVEQGVHDGQQQGGVGARGDRQPFVGLGGGRGAHRVDDDHGVDAPDDAHHVRGGQQRALRGGRVGAHHHQQVGAFDVGNREAPPVAVHQVRREVLGPLVDGAGRVADRDARHAQQHAGVAAQRERVRQRVAGVAGDRPDAVLGDHRRQQFGAAPERRVPADLLPLPVDLDHRAYGSGRGRRGWRPATRPSGTGARGSRRRRGCRGCWRHGRRRPESPSRTWPHTADRCRGGGRPGRWRPARCSRWSPPHGNSAQARDHRCFVNFDKSRRAPERITQV